MSAAKDLARKRKNYTMGEYSPSDEELKAYLWGVKNSVRIGPKRVPNKNEWYVEIYTQGKWSHSRETFGPGDVFKQIYKYYEYYYNKR